MGRGFRGRGECSKIPKNRSDHFFGKLDGGGELGGVAKEGEVISDRILQAGQYFSVSF